MRHERRTLATNLISPQEYLSTGYQPDVEYIDGVLVDKPVPTVSHGTVEAAATIYFGSHRKEWQIRVLPNTRLMVSATRYRLPDVFIVEAPFPKGPAVTEAPVV